MGAVWSAAADNVLIDPASGLREDGVAVFLSESANRQEGDSVIRNNDIVRWGLGALLLAFAGNLKPISAGIGPENVAVVVNADSRASQAIANEYIALRRIPFTNVVHLTELPKSRTVDVQAFRAQILLPVLECLYRRGVLEQIDCMTYSAGFPTVINVEKDLSATTATKEGTPPFASITGLTYFYPFVLARRPVYLKQDVNFYRRRPAQPAPSTPQPAAKLETYQRGLQLLEAKQWKAALNVLRPLAAQFKSNATIQYDLACCLARLDRRQEALTALDNAVQAGWSDRKHAADDPSLNPVKHLSRFHVLAEKMDENRSQPFTVQPTTAFSAQYQWNARGEKTASPGMRYMLASVLGLTAGGPHGVKETTKALRRNATADATQPKGTVYFINSADESAVKTSSALVSAVTALEKTRLSGRILRGELPNQSGEIAGMLITDPGFDGEEQLSTSILPGAICEQSFEVSGERERGTPPTVPHKLIRCGAAGVCCPLAAWEAGERRRPHPFIHVHYAHGCTLAEAFYQAVSRPHQALLLGDPLCQPWAKPLRIRLEHPQPNEDISGTLTVKPRVLGGPVAARRLDHYELFVDGQEKRSNEKDRFTLDTQCLAGGWHELRLVAVSQGPSETKSHVVLPITVTDEFGGIELEFVGDFHTPIRWGQSITVRATMKLKATIKVSCYGRQLGTISGPQGTLRIDSRQLGSGPVSLQASTKVAGKPTYSKPLRLRVTPPKISE